MRQFFPGLYLTAMCAVMVGASPSSAAEFTAKDLANEEGKFAAYSVKNGMRAAFLEFFAEQSWLLRPEPVDAQAWIRGRPDPKIVLDWKSQRTVLSASGDLGFSTGPSIYRSTVEPMAPASHGEFFSVWQKQRDGQWKVLIDHGISHGATASPDALSTAPLVAIDLPAQKQSADLQNDNPEQQFIARSGNDAIGAYMSAVSTSTRLLRDDRFPIDGSAAIQEFLKAQEGHWSWTVKMAGMSIAKDFAYAVGNFTWQPQSGAARKGQYVRVWMRQGTEPPTNRWTLAAEIMTPAPLPKP